jgi:SAP domain
MSESFEEFMKTFVPPPEDDCSFSPGGFVYTFDMLTVPALKYLCKTKSLPVSGSKKVLCKRLEDAGFKYSSLQLEIEIIQTVVAGCPNAYKHAKSGAEIKQAEIEQAEAKQSKKFRVHPIGRQDDFAPSNPWGRINTFDNVSSGTVKYICKRKGLAVGGSKAVAAKRLRDAGYNDKGMQRELEEASNFVACSGPNCYKSIGMEVDPAANKRAAAVTTGKKKNKSTMSSSASGGTRVPSQSDSAPAKSASSGGSGGITFESLTLAVLKFVCKRNGLAVGKPKATLIQSLRDAGCDESNMQSELEQSQSHVKSHGAHVYKTASKGSPILDASRGVKRRMVISKEADADTDSQLQAEATPIKRCKV